MSYKSLQFFTSLSKLKTIFTTSSAKHVIILMGKSHAGKTTLIHYIVGSNIVSDVDQQGSDILTIQSDYLSINSRKQTIFNNLLQIISIPQQSILFIKVIGFPNENNSKDQNQQWSLVIDYLLYQLSTIKQQSKVSFIFIFSLQQFGQNPGILIQYKKSLQNLINFEQRTHVVISHIGYEDQFHQFIQNNTKNSIQQQNDCQYIDQIIQQQRIFGFYSHTPTKQQQTILKQQIYNSQLITKIQISSLGIQFKSILDEKQWSNVFQECYDDVKTILQLINCTFRQILLSLKDIKSSDVAEWFDYDWGALNQYEQATFTINKTLLQSTSMKQFIKMYQSLRKTINQQRQLIGQALIQHLNTIQQFWPIQLINKGIFCRLQLLRIICRSLQKNNFQQQHAQQIQNIFINAEKGVFQDSFILQFYDQIKSYLSPDLKDYYEQFRKSKKKKKIIKKIKLKPMIPNYQQQKKIYLQKYKNQQDIYSLLMSPLKIDLFLTLLQQKKSLQKRNILQQKQIIRYIIQLLRHYQCYQQATKFAWIIPDPFKIYTLTISLIDKQGINQIKPFVNDVLMFLHSINRIKFKNQIENKVKTLTNLQQLIKTQVINKQLEQQKYFMNYEKIKVIMQKKQDLIQKCIKIQSQQKSQFNRKIAKQWILNKNLCEYNK